MARQTVSVSGKSLSRGVRSPRKLPSGCLIPFFGIFFLVGSIIFVAMFVWPLGTYFAAKQWVETPCTVTSSQVVTDDSSDGPTYRAEIKFRYRFDDQDYESVRHKLVQVGTNSRAPFERIVAQYPVGLETTCFVNPRQPSSAVLNRDLTLDFLFGLFPLLFVFVGLGGMIYFWRQSRKPSGAAAVTAWLPVRTAEAQQADSTHGTAASRWSASPGALSSSLDDLDDDVAESGDEALPPRLPDGPRVLKPESTPLTSFFAVLFIAIFWNGIVSIFVGVATKSVLDGKPEWFLLLFLIPFVLVGLGLILGTVYAMLGIFNPRPTIELFQSNLCLGDRTELRWQFSGNTGSIRKFRLALQGAERAKYRRGTNTYTDTSIFVDIPLVETESPLEIAEGRAELAIPDKSMHTFLGTNNQIEWRLTIHGDVPFWPDVQAGFPIHVHPMPFDEEIEL